MANNDYAAKQQEKIKHTTEKLEQGIQDFLSGEQFQDYLKVMSRFHNYSYSNSILIAMQRPDATLLAGYSGWQKKFKRHVLPGEKGIKIFAPAPIKKVTEKERLDPDTNLPVLDENGDPVREQVEVKIPMFKVVTVFDVAQTDGQPLPELGVNDLTGNVAGYEDFMEAIRRTADVPVTFEDIPGESHGYFSPDKRLIAIQEGMSEAQTLKTGIHELTHSRLHDIERESGKGKTKAVPKDRNTIEVEAESVAFVVCDHFGLDTGDYSFGYIGTWSSGKELPELKSSLQTIRDASNNIITEMEAHLADIRLEREQQQAVSQEQGREDSEPEPAVVPEEPVLYNIEGHSCVPADEWRSPDGTYFLMGNEVEHPETYHVLVNNAHHFDFEGKPEREAVERVFFDFLEQEYGSQEETLDQTTQQQDAETAITIDGEKCLRVDEWTAADHTFVLGCSVEEPTFYYALIDNHLPCEYDHKPTRAEVEDGFFDLLEQQKEITRNPDGEHNFRIEKTDHNTYCVHSDSERFGKDAIVFESSVRGNCVNYIADRKEPEAWRFYVIPDLKSWSNADPGQSPTHIEHYDTLSEAVARFRELRDQPYNSVDAPIPETDRSYARLTLGIEGVNVPSAVDVIHVEAGKNVLCEDFARLTATNTDQNALDAVASIAGEIPIDQVNHYHTMTPEEVKAFTLAHLLDKLHREGVTDTSAVEAGFDAYYESGGADYLKPSQNKQRGFTLIDYASWENPYFSLPEQEAALEKTPEEQLAADLADFCRAYDPYSFEPPEGETDTLAAGILDELHMGKEDGIRKWLQEVIDAGDEESPKAQALMERIERQFPPEVDPELPTHEATISFFAAECMEFPHTGIYQNHLSLEEALAVYDSIPPERMNAIPCVGFELQDGSIYDGEYPLMHGGQIDHEAIGLVEHYKEHPLVQKAITDLQAILDARTAAQERAAEREADPDEVCYKVGSMYLHIQEASDGSWDYTLYSSQLGQIDGGQIGTPETPLSEVRNDLVTELSYGSKKTVTEIPIEEFEQMMADREQSLKCPIFPKTLTEVFGTPELETWRICHRANTACKEQFDKEYGPAYHDRQVPEFLQKMVDRYGLDRCKLVLASTIQLANYDGRYYPQIKEAAAKVHIPGATNDHHDVRQSYRVTCHPVMVNVAFRDLLEMGKERDQDKAKSGQRREGAHPEKAGSKKPSVLKKLKANQDAIAAADKKPPSAVHDKKQLE